MKQWTDDAHGRRRFGTESSKPAQMVFLPVLGCDHSVSGPVLCSIPARSRSGGGNPWEDSPCPRCGAVVWTCPCPKGS